MKLSDVLQGIDYQCNDNTEDVTISKIEVNSKNIKSGDLFVAISGKLQDGHDYITDAIERGAIGVIKNKNHDFQSDSICVVNIEDTRLRLSKIVNNYYGNPTNSFKLIGVIGTNGKTSVTTMTNHIYTKLGYRTGLIGTIDNYLMQEKIAITKTNPTTPDCIELGEIMSMFNESHVDAAFMEVSSMALKMHRVDGCQFDIVVFINLSPEHLDDYGSMEDYKKSKLKLFQMAQKAVVNGDDAARDEVIQACRGEVLTFGLRSSCDLYADQITYYTDRVEFLVHYQTFEQKAVVMIPSEFAIYNSLAALGVCIMDNMKLTDAVKYLADQFSIAGRYELLSFDTDFSVIIDYAHTPVALENLLKSVRHNTKYKKVISVFGCGGDRDKSKRAPMGAISQELADFTVITSDNPRSEAPEQIINDIVKGIDSFKHNFYVEEDRRKAIRFAIEMAQKDDVIVISGKGHEKVQILNGLTIEFDDKLVADQEYQKCVIAKGQ